MKILVASSSRPDKGSGINTYCRILCNALVRMGHRVYYLCPKAENGSWLDTSEVIHFSCDQKEAQVKAAKRILDIFGDESIDGAINNDNSLLQSIAPALSCPVISVGHMERANVAALTCYNHNWIDYVVAISSDMQQVFTTKYGIPVTKCPVVYSGVPDPGHIEIKKIMSEGLSVVFGGGMSRNKGGRLIRKAIKYSKDQLKDIKIHWFGDVPRYFVRELSNLANVFFYGRVPRAQFLEVLARSDVLLLPSSYEGCPMTMLEAMSYGVVPVASDGRGAMRWLIDSAVHGYICNLKRWHIDMIDALSFLRDHPDKLYRMKKAVRERFLAHYRDDIVAERLVSLLQSPTVIRKRPQKRLTILRWHRPLREDGRKAPIVDRLCIRMGWLRREGVINV